MQDEKHILLAISHPLTRDLLARLLRQEVDLRVQVKQCEAKDIWREAAEADAIITETTDDELPGSCTHLLAEYPHLVILVVSLKSDRTFLYRQAIVVEELKGSAEEIITALRGLKK